ncbi:hypothetical protein B296_00017812 [Ensete ventricosum]|uniref:Uncharacterized protein n=1 Tax=Ensete ventricosum TaxID=4639 RepID=A0A426ZAA5_ENSVE|nr:hypothetical protein B296_00017812 [Ensete ventricosum]
MLLPPLPHFQPSVPCFTLPSPSAASSSYPKEDCCRPPLFLLSSSIASQSSAAHYPCRRYHPLAVDILHPLAATAASAALASAISLPPLSSLPSPPCCRCIPCVPCSQSCLPLHLHHRRCQLPDPALPNLFLAVASIAGHNRAPLQSPPLLAASPLLSALTTATCRQSPLPPPLPLLPSLPQSFPIAPLPLHLPAATATTPCYRLLSSAPSPTPLTAICI